MEDEKQIELDALQSIYMDQFKRSRLLPRCYSPHPQPDLLVILYAYSDGQPKCLRGRDFGQPRRRRSREPMFVYLCSYCLIYTFLCEEIINWKIMATRWLHLLTPTPASLLSLLLTSSAQLALCLRYNIPKTTRTKSLGCKSEVSETFPTRSVANCKTRFWSRQMNLLACK
jgi:hypothetical protein